MLCKNEDATATETVNVRTETAPETTICHNGDGDGDGGYNSALRPLIPHYKRCMYTTGYIHSGSIPGTGPGPLGSSSRLYTAGPC